MSSQDEFKINHDVKENKIEKISLTNEEIAKLQLSREAAVKESDLQVAKLAEFQAAKQALLNKLGITADEAKILLG